MGRGELLEMCLTFLGKLDNIEVRYISGDYLLGVFSWTWVTFPTSKPGYGFINEGEP
jgi:hypothetical protein